MVLYAVKLQGLVDQLQHKMTSYKKQVEEAEEIAALNLAKFRQVQVAAAETEERASLSEQALARIRASARYKTTTVTKTQNVFNNSFQNHMKGFLKKCSLILRYSQTCFNDHL